MASIRDFVYLDWERLRSFVAQADRGVPETRSGSISDEHALATDGEAGLFGIMKGSLSDDRRYSRVASETRSLHHAVFSDFERYLRGNGLLGSLDEWRREVFSEGGFFGGRGRVRIVDYAAVATMLRGLPDVMAIGGIAEKGQVMSDASLDHGAKQARLKQIDKGIKAQQKEMRDSGLPAMSAMVEQLYGDGVRIKILPERRDPDELLVGTVGRSSIDADVIAAIGSSGYATFVAVDFLVYVEPLVDLTATADMSTGNPLEDVIDGAVTMMDQMAQITQGFEFPTLTCTPIAIYRTVAASTDPD